MEATTVYDHVDHFPIAAGKIVEVTLAWYVRDYKVVDVTNTTYLKPGMWFTPAAIEQLCQLPNVKAKMVDNAILSFISGIAGGLGKLAVPIP